MSVLFIGDIVGETGKRAVTALVAYLLEECKLDFIIANCENAAVGRAVTRKISEYLFACGIHVLTLGNQVWDTKEIIPYIETSRDFSSLLIFQNQPLPLPAKYSKQNGK